MSRFLLRHLQDSFTRTRNDVLITCQYVGGRQRTTEEFKTRRLNKTFV